MSHGRSQTKLWPVTLLCARLQKNLRDLRDLRSKFRQKSMSPVPVGATNETVRRNHSNADCADFRKLIYGLQAHEKRMNPTGKRHESMLVKL